jgi:hypothetical protein
LNENDWDIKFKNCSAFYGWTIDFEGNKIVRAPHAGECTGIMRAPNHQLTTVQRSGFGKVSTWEKVQIMVRESREPTPPVEADTDDTEKTSVDEKKKAQEAASKKQE